MSFAPYIAPPAVCFVVMFGIAWYQVRPRQDSRTVETGCPPPVSTLIDVSDLDWAWPPFVPYGRPVRRLPWASTDPESGAADAGEASAVRSSELRSERRPLWGA